MPPRPLLEGGVYRIRNIFKCYCFHMATISQPIWMSMQGDINNANGMAHCTASINLAMASGGGNWPLSSLGRVLRISMALVFDPVNPHVLGPAEFPGHADVELALQGVFAALLDDQVMAPAYFSHQRCEFWKTLIGLKKPFIRHRSEAENPPTPGNSCRRSAASCWTIALPQVSPACRSTIILPISQ